MGGAADHDEQFLAVAAGLPDGGQVGEARLGQLRQQPGIEVTPGAAAVDEDGVFGDPEGHRAARPQQPNDPGQGRRQRLPQLDVVDRADRVDASGGQRDGVRGRVDQPDPVPELAGPGRGLGAHHRRRLHPDDTPTGHRLGQQPQSHPGTGPELDHRLVAGQPERGDDPAGQLCVAARHRAAHEAAEQSARTGVLGSDHPFTLPPRGNPNQ
jgi:hypothetical protein